MASDSCFISADSHIVCTVKNTSCILVHDVHIYVKKLVLVLCDTHDTSILIVDTYATIPISPRSRYTAIYRSSTKYHETAQESRVSSIPATYCIMSTCVRCILHATILPLCYSVLMFSPFLFSPTEVAIEIGLL